MPLRQTAQHGSLVPGWDIKVKHQEVCSRRALAVLVEGVLWDGDWDRYKDGNGD